MLPINATEGSLSIVTHENPIGFQQVKWMNQVTSAPGQLEPSSIRAAHEKARLYNTEGGEDRKRQMRNAYVDLFTELVPEFQFSMAEQKTGEAISERRWFADADSDKINIVQGLSDLGENPKVLDGAVFFLDYGLRLNGDKNFIPFANEIETTRPTFQELRAVLFIDSSFFEKSRFEVLSILSHEFVHLGQQENGLRLLREWIKTDTKDGFKKWLTNQVERRRVSSVDSILAVESLVDIYPNESPPNGEILATTTQFIEGFHINGELAFDNLEYITDYWAKGDATIQHFARRRIAAYFQTLNTEDKRSFRALLNQRIDQHPFYRSINKSIR